MTKAIVKCTKDIENLDSLVSVEPLELDDTIDCLHDYSSLPPEESVAHFATQENSKDRGIR